MGRLDRRFAKSFGTGKLFVEQRGILGTVKTGAEIFSIVPENGT
jgi:hypothetical protein